MCIVKYRLLHLVPHLLCACGMLFSFWKHWFAHDFERDSKSSYFTLYSI